MQEARNLAPSRHDAILRVLADTGSVVSADLALRLGASTLLLAQALAPDLRATVVTASPDVALALREHAGIDVDLLGGRVDRVSQTVVGADTVAQVRALRPDACLVGACSVDPVAGVTLREREEADVVRALLERSARRILLASADKLGTASPYVVAPMDGIDVLVTD